ncbi:MAG: 30S ribosomal protein S12 methylthiotransferase RimO [Sedimentisphaerales bacterium]|nr:30S ribosomal protein S12 methylthiotransferase RimO [Sedimentisphaerales bacterium]
MVKKKRQITVGFVSLGCPKNSVDSERMLAEIVEAGFAITPESYNADVIVINTCAFIAPAQAESLEVIMDALASKADPKQRLGKVIVAGCLPEKLGRNALGEIAGVDAVIGLDKRDNIAKIIRQVLSSDRPVVALDESDEQGCNRILDDRTRLLITPGHWAYLRISEGCNHRCSFCTIPAIRGRFRSKPPELVLAEARELVSAGVVELNVIAQDTTFYGCDLKMQDGLAFLVEKIGEIPSLTWIRLMYLYPAGFSPRLIETIAKSERIVHYLDIPLQHISDDILKSMRRPDTKDRIIKLIEDLRSAMPDVVLRTTLIVGYPGETDKHFSELLDFVRWAEFDALGCFRFYPEAGTAAADMSNQVPDEIKQQRLDEMMLCQQEIAFAKNRSRIGDRITCLVDSVESKLSAKGRFYGQAPEIDSLCLIEYPERRKNTLESGRFIPAKVIGSKNYDLIVEPI